MGMTQEQSDRLFKVFRDVGSTLTMSGHKIIKITGTGVLEGSTFFMDDTPSDEDFEYVLDLIRETASLDDKALERERDYGRYGDVNRY